MTRLAQVVIVKVAFIVICFGGIATFWALPRPIRDFSLVFTLAWVVITSKLLTWFFVKVGWTTEEIERGSGRSRSRSDD